MLEVWRLKGTLGQKLLAMGLDDNGVDMVVAELANLAPPLAPPLTPLVMHDKNTFKH